jgi:hypothetical protein
VPARSKAETPIRLATLPTRFKRTGSLERIFQSGQLLTNQHATTTLTAELAACAAAHTAATVVSSAKTLSPRT